MTIVQLSYIIAVDNFKSFAKAAKNCYVTQPTLSMQIKKLEDELGVLIFDRTKKPVAPTDIGVKIIEQARTVTVEHERIKEVIREESEEIRGKFKLGIIPTVAPYLLPLFVESFTKKYNALELIIEELQTDRIVDRLRRDELDAAILATPLFYKDITERPVYYEPFVGYVSQSHRLYKNKTVNPEQLDVKDLFLLKEGHCFRDHVLQICKYYGDKKIGDGKTVNLEGATLETLMKMVDKNIGMTLIPYLAMKEIEGAEKIKRIKKFKDPVPTREISIVYHRTQLKKKLIDLLETEILKSIPKELAKNKHEYVVVSK
ncbi:MAG: LysR substrate-binding domain-containing protein [Melioribacteraceae bacterium]|nr:LysR substrate-binding domain-containing protein [Melioribacteraceae bacterium]